MARAGHHRTPSQSRWFCPGRLDQEDGERVDERSCAQVRNHLLAAVTLRDDDGTIKATFDIPASLADRSTLDIRVENKALGIYYFVNFKNKK